MKIDYVLPRQLSEPEQAFISSALERSFNIVAIEVSNSDLSIEIAGDISEDRFHEVMQNLLYVSRSISRKVLYEKSARHAYSDNPMQALLGSGDVVSVSAGMFSFQGSFLKVLKACQDYALGLAQKYSAIEQEHPVLWPVDLYKKINYFSEFPQQVIMGAPVENSFEKRDDFARTYEKDQSYDSVSTKKHFANASYGLQCAVCDTCYYNMRGSRDHENSIYTTCNKVFRNETSSTGSLDRLTTFTVRDIMFVGDRDFVLLYRQKMLDEAEDLLRRLDLESKIETADDPFFSNDSVVKNVFQSASELKHELLVKLRHSDSFMAVGSVNLHLDFFGQAFDIQAPDNSAVYSGCFGIGFERLTYALYCQYGTDIQAWPDQVKETLRL